MDDYILPLPRDMNTRMNALHRLNNGAEGRHILIAVTRYLAAHSPTERAALQTADIARRLMLGSDLQRNT